MMRGASIKAAPSALRQHWPEYLMEAIELGLFMISASLFALLLFHPSSPVARSVESATLRRLLMGMAMGMTAVCLVYSPLGQRSGAHMNPALTLAFWRLGRIETADAVFYVLAQFAGAIAGMLLVAALAGGVLRHESVNFVTTTPGVAGALGLALAWSGEFVISLILMLVVLSASNRRSVARFTGLFAGALIATYIFLESPLSGMSMNPARTFGSALTGDLWRGLWVYFTAPPLAMLAASQIYVSLAGRVYCAKLNHWNRRRCIFKCRFHELTEAAPGRPGPPSRHTQPQPVVIG